MEFLNADSFRFAQEYLKIKTKETDFPLRKCLGIWPDFQVFLTNDIFFHPTFELLEKELFKKQ